MKNTILPRAALESSSVDNYLDSIKGARASFWNIVRTDLFASYQQQSHTQVNPDDIVLWKSAGLRLPIETSSIQPTDFAGSASSNGREDETCRNLVWILAKAMNFLALDASSRLEDQFSNVWNDVRELLEQWHKSLPNLFQPYASLPLSNYNSGIDSIQSSSRFVRQFYNVPMCAVAMQFYHFVQLLLLMKCPVEASPQGASRLHKFRKVSEESKHHSRQICNIALGVQKPIAAREQMIQPLYVAGICFEEDVDRSVVVDLLSSIYTETGCPTLELLRDLRSTWGWEDHQAPSTTS
jgi:hypothetical protein